MIVKLAQTTLKTKFGTFTEHLYYDGQKESIAFFMGEMEGAESLLCRLHSSCIHGHYFNSIECTCQEEMSISQELIQQEGGGLIILLDQEGKGNGHHALLKSIEFKRKGIPQADAYVAAGFQKDARDFAASAKIIKELGISSIRLLTNNPKKVRSLEEHGIVVSGTREIKL